MRLCAVVLLAACGRVGFDETRPDTPPPISPELVDGYVSGTRLKHVWHEFEDLSRSWDTVYDSETGEMCQPYPWFDGINRCTPDGAIVRTFLDAACTQPVGYAMTQPAPTYFYEYDFCVGVTGIDTAGAAVTPTAIYTTDPFNGCYQMGIQPGTYYSLVPKSRDTYAPLSLDAPAPEGVSLRSYHSVDGFSVPSTLHDATVGDCRSTPGEPVLHCLPSISRTSMRADATCSTLLAADLAACPQPPGRFAGAISSCDTEVYPYAAEYTGPVWNSAPGVCMATTRPAPFVTYLVGPPVPLPALEREVGAVAGRRLQNVYDRAPLTGAHLRTSQMYDSLLGADCSPYKATDGTTRCIPDPFASAAGSRAALVTRYYSDAACSVPLDLALATKICGITPSPLYGARSVGGAFELTMIGTPYSGTFYQLNGSCQVYSPLPEQTFFTVGATIDPAMLATTMPVIDP